MEWQLAAEAGIDEAFVALLERYRANYLRFFLDYFREHRRPDYRGGYFNINSITGEPYAHNCCYSWTDGRSLAELSISHLLNLGDRDRLREYADHIFGALVERFDRNGYLPHAVEDATNLASDDPMNLPIGEGQSSYSHVFVMNGLYQYEAIFCDGKALNLAGKLFADLRVALEQDEFLEGAEPRPTGHRAQGPFMITLGAIADILETLDTQFGAESDEFAVRAAPFMELGRDCVEHILNHHHREQDHAFWEVSAGDGAVEDERGVVITDPGHTIEFTGFASRFARYLLPRESQALTDTCRNIYGWAASRGFHPIKDLICKNIDRDTGEAIVDAHVPDISRVVSREVFEGYFLGIASPVHITTYPWWVPMEAIAAGAMLHHDEGCPAIDGYIVRSARGIFDYFINDRIGGLCCQSIGDGFFGPIDLPPATPTLDLMHSHRSLRIAVRELGSR